MDGFVSFSQVIGRTQGFDLKLWFYTRCDAASTLAICVKRLINVRYFFDSDASRGVILISSNIRPTGNSVPSINKFLWNIFNGT